jgi:hypothetical protein
MGATSRGIVLLQLVTLLLGASLADRFEKVCGQKLAMLERYITRMEFT